MGPESRPWTSQCIRTTIEILARLTQRKLTESCIWKGKLQSSHASRAYYFNSCPLIFPLAIVGLVFHGTIGEPIVPPCLNSTISAYCRLLCQRCIAHNDSNPVSTLDKYDAIQQLTGPTWWRAARRIGPVPYAAASANARSRSLIRRRHSRQLPLTAMG